MAVDIVDWVLIIIGQILIVIGVICDLIAAILMIRFPNFYVRLHALTIGSIGGAVVPIIGAVFIALGAEYLGSFRFFLAGGAIVTAIFVFILGALGSHAIARASHRSKTAILTPCYVDHLSEDRGEGGCR
ncbi:MAG: monovalent cation/H(+) antiporter subunit G [Desulfurococcaceae archaeon]|jgi:multicomponent Na+:H+ antiporter subunit G|nr:monovalent cation/H(+) antiporter subunit G [Desulfurococcaceae archaeon]